VKTTGDFGRLGQGESGRFQSGEIHVDCWQQLRPVTSRDEATDHSVKLLDHLT